MTMIPRKHSRRDSGFSLIEVMVAIVILSIGLLALASLQLTLMRNSAETKAQTTALALAKGQLENLAAYDSMTTYRGITDGNITIANPIGGVNYTGSYEVKRYVYDKAAGGAVKYVEVADTLSDAAIKGLDPDYLPGREFKRIVVTVQWDDSAGAKQQVRVEDAISAIEPTDSIAVNKFTSTGGARKAQTVITNPGSVAGVIPIAIGNGTNTAATNPRPILLAQGQNSTLVETRFDIFTYAALNGATATAQSRVETSVVGCTCRTAGGVQTTFRPTYWNGSRYVAPDTRAGTPVVNKKSGVDQSDLCTACCRDHQDPSGVTGPKFDPRRATHNHYVESNVVVGQQVNMTLANQDYDDACRLIRVDGVFRVAQDTYNDYFGLLATAGLSQNTPTTTIANAVPGSTQTANYQAFVLNYLQARFIDGAQANYNVPIDFASVTGNSALDNPASANITVDTDPQYLHSRGLYVDYLTDDVRQQVHDAALPANCMGTDNAPADSTVEFQACVFKLLPFTSINLTEISSWTESNASKVDVTDAAFKDTINQVFPVKGRADAKVGATTGDVVTGSASVQRSSAGLAVTLKVFPDTELAETYVPNILTDANNQTFTIGLGNVTPVDERYYVLLKGAEMLGVVAYNNKPALLSTVSNQPCSSDEVNVDNLVASDMNKILGDDNATKPDEFRCTPDVATLPASVTTEISNYNRQANVAVGNPCSNEDTFLPYSKDFDVDSIDVKTLTTAGVDANNDGDYADVGDTVPVYSTASLGTGAPTNIDKPGTKANSGEYTTFTVNPLQNNMYIEVNFGARTNRCSANWSTYINANGAAKNFTNTDKQNYCIGNGNKQPNWDLVNWGACPASVTIP
jgi:type IV pilus modification protein PilV